MLIGLVFGLWILLLVWNVISAPWSVPIAALTSAGALDVLGAIGALLMLGGIFIKMIPSRGERQRPPRPPRRPFVVEGFLPACLFAVIVLGIALLVGGR
jgi:hypothetical protein